MAPRPQGGGWAPGSRTRPARAEPSGAASDAGSSATDAGLKSLFEEASQLPPPGREEQAALLRRAADGDEAARGTLVKTKLEMVGRKAAARADRGLPFGDLVQEGSIGLMAAIDYFRGSGRDDFDAFA